MNELPLGITLLMNRRPFLLLLAHVLFAITDGGIATCLKAATGEIVWQERVGGNFSASPVAAEGWICFVGDGGETTIIAAGPVFWRHFEQRVLDLQRLGIEADLILWHPYDRRGLARMNGEPDDRHLRYCIARPGAFRNVGWSLANELDCMSNLDGKHPGRKAWSASRKASTSAALSNKGGFPAAKSAEPDAPKADSDQDDAGFWSIPPGGRNLIHADGRARLLCADTAWALPWRATVEQAETQARGTSLDLPRASRVYDPRSGAEVGKGRLPDKAPVPFNGGLSSAPRVVVFAAATP